MMQNFKHDLDPKMFDGKGMIAIRLRRFPNLYKTNLLVNIKGAHSLALTMKDCVQSQILDPFVSDHDCVYLSSLNCVGYLEHQDAIEYTQGPFKIWAPEKSLQLVSFEGKAAV